MVSEPLEEFEEFVAQDRLGCSLLADLDDRIHVGSSDLSRCPSMVPKNAPITSHRPIFSSSIAPGFGVPFVGSPMAC